MKEFWKEIKGYEGLYEVSSLGRVRSMDRWVAHRDNSKKFIKGKIRKPSSSKNDYLFVMLYKGNQHKFHLIHRLVAEAFLDNPNHLTEVNHKDENKTNNCVYNLEYCTHKYNANYGTCIEKRAKKLHQYSLDGEFIREWESAAEIERKLGYGHSNIAACCNGKSKTSNGYIWKYA